MHIKIIYTSAMSCFFTYINIFGCVFSLFHDSTKSRSAQVVLNALIDALTSWQEAFSSPREDEAASASAKALIKKHEATLEAGR